MTYVFVPKTLINELFGRLSIPAPEIKPDFNRLNAGDTVPNGTDPNEIAYLGAFYANGVAHSFNSGPAGPGELRGLVG